MKAKTTSWRCTVCGYVHEGDDPPEFCPVCGAAAEEFEIFDDEVTASEVTPATGRWQCLMCNYMHTGDQPPEICPVCGSEREHFQTVDATQSPEAGGGRIVIIGAGIAGISAAEAARGASADAEITVLSQENALPYYRLNLTRVLAGDISPEELPIHPREWYEHQDIDLVPDTRVDTIDVEGGNVVTHDGRKIPYDRLIIASGSHPFIPPIEGIRLPGVFAVRSVADVRHLLDAAEKGGEIVCIGGGVLGLETAGALVQRGLPVTLLESHEWLMPRQLNRRAATRLERHVAAMGIALRKEARTTAILGSERVEGVRLADGTVLPAAIVVVTTGVRPNTSLARKAGLEVHNGIVVDRYLTTSAPNILAAGDVAEHNGVLYGLWGAALAQGTIAGLNAVSGGVSFGGIPRTSALKVLGIDLVSIGRFQPEDGSWVVLDDEAEDYLHHFVFRDGILVGAILMGDGNMAPAVRRAVEKRRNFARLLHGDVTAADIVQALRE